VDGHLHVRKGPVPTSLRNNAGARGEPLLIWKQFCIIPSQEDMQISWPYLEFLSIKPQVSEPQSSVAIPIAGTFNCTLYMPVGFNLDLEDLGDDDIALGPHLEVKTCDGFGWKLSSDYL